LELNEKQYFLVPKCESCICSEGAGHFCGSQTQYLQGTNCVADHLYNCVTRSIEATYINHCVIGCEPSLPGLAYCKGGIL